MYLSRWATDWVFFSFLPSISLAHALVELFAPPVFAHRDICSQLHTFPNNFIVRCLWWRRNEKSGDSRKIADCALCGVCGVCVCLLVFLCACKCIWERRLHVSVWATGADCAISSCLPYLQLPPYHYLYFVHILSTFSHFSHFSSLSLCVPHGKPSFFLASKNSNKDQSPLCVSKTNMRSMFVVFSGCFFFCFVTEGLELTGLHWSKAFVGSRTWVHRRLVSSSGSFVYKQYRADRTLSGSDSLHWE